MIAKTYLPAEWSQQSAIQLTWPHQNTDWADQLEAVERVYFDLAAAILKYENLLVSCEDPLKLQGIESTLKPIAERSGSKLCTFTVPADDTWARDHGPITVFENKQPVLLDFRFNAWGDKYRASKDDAITKTLAELGAYGANETRAVDMILEGGSIESDGEGTLLTTEKCLLNESRNSGWSKKQIEAALQQHLGVKRTLWLKHGFLAGDDTDAHIDTLARFCTRDLICYVSCTNEGDEHFDELKLMETELRGFVQESGLPYTLVPLPMASPIYDGNKRLPATYANFLIINGAVLAPVYDVPEDQQALEQLQKCFPSRDIVAINCAPLIKQHGSLHCITMQIPAGVVS